MKDRKSIKDFMLVPNLNKTIDELAVTNSVHLYGCVEEGGCHDLRRELYIEVEGQGKKKG